MSHRPNRLDRNLYRVRNRRTAPNPPMYPMRGQRWLWQRRMLDRLRFQVRQRLLQQNPKPAPLPPVASPVAPAVTGGLVAAPLVAAAAADTDESEQESPFKDTHSGASKPSLEDDRSVESRANTTLTPTDRPSGDAADQPATKLETGRPGHSSVAEDMDALLDELSAKR